MERPEPGARMPQVVALYRYPVKSFTPESCDSLVIGAGGRVVGDRVLGFRFADTEAADDAWSTKHGMLALVNTAGLARLRLHFDDEARRLSIRVGDELLVEAGLDPAGRDLLCEAVTDFVSGLDGSGLHDRPERLPLRLVGDGVSPRLHDDPDPSFSLHSRASLRELGGELGDDDLDEVRFRSNVVVDGVDAWSELDWPGRRVRVGGVTAVADHVKFRCLATHVDPDTGERDRPVMKTLVSAFGQEKPTFAIGLTPEGPGRIVLGDPVELLD